ncbi:MAG: AsmA family protein [Pseudomonadota bacterium]
MRVLLWIIGVPLVLIVLAAVLSPMLLDKDELVQLAAEQIESESGIQLSVDGDASLRLFPKVALSMSGVRAEFPDDGGLVEAESLSTGVALLPLFTGTVEISSLNLDGITYTTVVVDEAVAEAATLDTSTLSDAELDVFYAVRDQMRETSAAQAAVDAMVVPLSLEVGELALRDIRAVTVDRSGATISEVLLEELVAQDINTEGRAVPLTAIITLPDDEAPMDITLDMIFRTDLDARMLHIDELTARVVGATPEPLALTAEGDFNIQTQIAEVDIALQSDGLAGDGKLRFASFESPQIDASLNLSELTPALLVLAGPEAAAAEAEATETAPEETSSSGPTSLPLHSLRMIDTKADLRIARVTVDAHVLENVEAGLRVVDGVATLDPVKANLHGGAIDFKAVFNGRYNTAQLSTEGSVADFDVGQATAALDAGVEASGTAMLNWSLNGQGADGDALIGSLNGPIGFSTEDITVVGIAMQQMVCRGVALVNQEALSGEFPVDTHFDALSADIQLEDGVARLDPLTAQLPAVGLTGNGNLDIASGDLRASLRAQLADGLGELDPACRINERYTELRWPVECKGNLSGDPGEWCGIDATEIVKDLAEGELKRKAGEEAGRLLKNLLRRDGL